MLTSNIIAVYHGLILLLLSNVSSAEYSTLREVFRKLPLMVNSYNMNYTYPPKKVIWIKYQSYRQEHLPTNFNWNYYGLSIPVKRQVSGCNACWAYATSSLAEAMYELENRRMQPSFNYSPYADSFGKSERFSELELLLCYGKGDCRDRSTQNVFEYAAKHGLLPERQMNQNSMCWPETQFQFNTLYSIQSDEESIKSYIVNHGPVILHLYLPVNVLKDYIGDDVIAPFPECDGKKPNHAMLAIGYGVQNGVKYWLLQNSWGLDWGNMGYVKWRRGIDACSVESSPIGASFLKNW